MELFVTSAGLPLARHVLTNTVEAEAHADQVRAAWESAGWAAETDPAD